jgi:hypothetical protein
MESRLRHPSLDANLKGLEVKLDGAAIVHYRGIPYGNIPRRFAKADLIDQGYGHEPNCTQFG